VADVGCDVGEVSEHFSSLLEACVDLLALRQDRVTIPKEAVGFLFSGSRRPPGVDELSRAGLDVKPELVLDVAADVAPEKRGVATPHRCSATHRMRVSTIPEPRQASQSPGLSCLRPPRSEPMSRARAGVACARAARERSTSPGDCLPIRPTPNRSSLSPPGGAGLGTARLPG